MLSKGLFLVGDLTLGNDISELILSYSSKSLTSLIL